MKSFYRATVRRLALVPILLAMASPSYAGGNPVVNALMHTPVSVFSYGIANLHDDFSAAFAREKAIPYAMFKAPLSGRIADIATVNYSNETDTITLNLVKIYKLDVGASPDDACRQAMAALRTYAGLDPTTGKLQGLDASLLAVFFQVNGSPLPDAANQPDEIDKLFRLRFNGSTDRGRFTCTANLFGSGYELGK